MKKPKKRKIKFDKGKPRDHLTILRPRVYDDTELVGGVDEDFDSYFPGEGLHVRFDHDTD